MRKKPFGANRKAMDNFCGEGGDQCCDYFLPCQKPFKNIFFNVRVYALYL